MTRPRLADVDTVYTYGSKLETASPRFSQPGDFFTYLVFVCITVLVGYIFSNVICFNFLWHLTLSARTVQFTQLLRFLEMRKITPSLRLVHHSQSIQKDQSAVEAWWEVPMRKLVSIPQLGSGGCGSLHFITHNL